MADEHDAGVRDRMQRARAPGAVRGFVRTAGRAGALAVLALLPRVAPAAADPPSAELMQAAAVVLTHDALAIDCRQRGGPSADVAAKTAAWESANGVPRVRVQLAELMSDPVRRAQLRDASQSVLDVVRREDIDPCAAAASLTRTREAQFGALVPEPTSEDAAPPARGLPPAASSASPAAARVPPAPASVSPAPSSVPSATVAQMEGFAFDTRGRLGYGGLVTIDVYPLVLFRDGRLLTDVTGLAHSAGLDAHRREHPEDWSRWRRAGGELQREGKDGWRKVAYQKTYARLPAGLRLEGTFRRLGGTGTLGAGGNDAVAVWAEYAFTPDGRVVRTGGAGARSEAGDVSTVTRGAAPRRTGTYRVDGLRLAIEYDDGTRETPVLVLDPADPKGAIWLDGLGYARRRP